MSDKNNKFEETASDQHEPAGSAEAGFHPEKPERAEEANSKEKPRSFVPWVIALAIIGIAALSAVFLLTSANSEDERSAAQAETEADDQNESGSREVKLDREALNSANIEIEGVSTRPAIALIKTTGTIETNPQQTQYVTPLVSGRVEKMTVSVGDYVNRGKLLAVISSPQIAQMHGKMHEAETKLGIAERNLARVQKTENRVAVLQSKAKLDEAAATLKRVKRLIELEAGAGKDLIAAETSYKTAKAEYDFQRNISLNKEIQESKAEVETARVDLRHILDEMRSLGVELSDHDADRHRTNTSLISIYAPAAGMVTERPVNPGSGIDGGTTLFVLSNLSTVFAIANVPESQMPGIRVGTMAEISSPALREGGVITARVSYIDPTLKEDTRTGMVRLEVPNSGGTLRAGMFVDIGFQTSSDLETGEELVVNSEAVHRVGEKNVVFIPKPNEPGAFEVREIVVGLDLGGYTRIKSGLRVDEKVVTKGSFTLKTQLEKGQMSDDH
ncbi:MAG: efflux RND transporter periplasmic adaptor subunit [Acidobacteria bacterium]|nr:efflux RND transporter periplasmic adaptor subunit [Acidobacteriota bacterium]